MGEGRTQSGLPENETFCFKQNLHLLLDFHVIKVLKLGRIKTIKCKDRVEVPRLQVA